MNMAAKAAIGGVHTSILFLDFERLKAKQRDRKDGFFEGHDLDLVEREYRRFLELHRADPSAVIVPCTLVDEFWHAHILDTLAYHADCEAVFGHYLHHFPYFGRRGAEDAAALEDGFAATRERYIRHFGEAPPVGLATRCGGHKCHVPSECRCRAPGACK